MRFLVVSLVVLTVALGLVSSQQQGQELTPRQKQLLLERRQQLLLQQRKLEQSKKVPVGGPTKPTTEIVSQYEPIKRNYFRTTDIKYMQTFLLKLYKLCTLRNHFCFTMQETSFL